MNGAEFMRKNNQANDCRMNKRYRSAIKYYKEVIHNFPEHTMFLAYNLGTIYQTELGYGDKSKDCYLKVVEWHNAQPDYRRNDYNARKTLDTILANTYENLTLLSDSYEEFFNWANKLKEINPHADVLKDNIPDVQNAEQMGLRWTQVYYETSHLFWDKEPTRDRGLYGFGASIFRRLILNREKSRLNPELYQSTARGYGALMLMIIARIGTEMESLIGRVEVEEVDFIIIDTISLLNKYLNTNRNDEIVRRCIGQLEETLTRMKMGKTGSKRGTIENAATETIKNNNKGKTQFDVKLDDLEWQKGNDLLEIANEIGFSKTTFKLESVNINPDEGALDLYFISESDFDAALAHQIGLGLRCVVARTLGIAAAATEGVYLMEPVPAYNIKLGKGVKAEAFSLMADNRRIGPLQTTSREIDNKWLVQVKPIQVDINNYSRMIQDLMFVFSKLVPTFKSIKEFRIRF